MSGGFRSPRVRFRATSFTVLPSEQFAEYFESLMDALKEARNAMVWRIFASARSIPTMGNV
jgi:hypothetical protein